MFFFNAAQIPNKIPSGTENNTDKILSDIETGNLKPIMVAAGFPGKINVDCPQSHLVNTFFNN